ncbi:MAG: type II toxin-antitoxin system RelE/ParE family toxin [Oscillospiraceae bacterium]|nr:type II toxin-antitoxin system RelE/ParE family toxin [Oscillospiraceae bacterium]
MTDVRLSAAAENDLIQIKSYITDELSNPTAASITLAKITKRIRKLEAFPELGPSLETILPFQSNYRFLVCGNYIAFYLYEQNTVSVDRILHGSRDFVKVLFGGLPQAGR